MRLYIFTEREKRILKTWLEDRTKLEDFRVLKHLIINNGSNLQREFELLQKALESFSET
ncbi:MAG: hypothetical protein NWE97_00220 [Candidatus Bathyarchaeota archaeon]|nr:hypothetical protein [Candidatus Bathyarchaeota archaeon]